MAAAAVAAAVVVVAINPLENFTAGLRKLSPAFLFLATPPATTNQAHSHRFVSLSFDTGGIFFEGTMDS
ncbi:MAG: hypothetical protein WCO56_13920, partial [Verrucomicrobiota bacterium]